ncbi:GumC family protein [Sulfitobacter sp. 1A05707]|uniref:GumC family protein n=1 Tax=Sulfitobacter sp. 1A05707 TaxID=3368560 RepID=UPI003744ED70
MGGHTALLIGAFYAYILATPLCHETAMPRLLPEQEQIIDFPNGAGRFSGDRAELNSEVEVLRGRGLLAQVVERLDLTADPEFSARFQSEETLRVQDAVISKLLEAVTIRNISQSRVLHVMVESEDARNAALIADTIVELYVSHQIETKEKAAEQAVVWLTERVTAMQTNLQTAEAKVSAFTAGTELVSVAALRGLERQIKELRSRIATAQEARVASERRSAALEAALTSPEKVIASADERLADLLDGMQEEPALGRAFEARFQTVLQLSREDLFWSQQRLAALRASEAELSAQVSQQSRDLITLQQITREAEAASVLYEHFLSRLNEPTALQGNHRANSRILSRAVVALRPSTPRQTLIIAMSAVFGLLASLAVVLGREMQGDGFRTAPDPSCTNSAYRCGTGRRNPFDGSV